MHCGLAFSGIGMIMLMKGMKIPYVLDRKTDRAVDL